MIHIDDVKHAPSFTFPSLNAWSAASFFCFAVASFKAVADGSSSDIDKTSPDLYLGTH